MKAAIFGVWLGSAGCAQWTYDTTVHYGGVASLSVAPSGVGVAIDAEIPAVPAPEDLGTVCAPHMVLQEARRADDASNRVLSVCAVVDRADGACLAEGSEVELLVLGQRAYLDVFDPDGFVDASGEVPVDGFTFDAEGSLDAVFSLAGDCLDGAVEHEVRATWAFAESDTFREGKVEWWDPNLFGRTARPGQR